MTSQGSLRLVAIVSVDVAGYSARTEADSADAAAEIRRLRIRLAEVASRNGGRIFNTSGDGAMLEFPSARAAMAAIRGILVERPIGEPHLRIGAHLGDVSSTDNGDLLGHGVNVAARLMAIAPPGAAMISGEIKAALGGDADVRAMKSVGEVALAKMQTTVMAFEFVSTASKPASASEVAQPHNAIGKGSPNDLASGRAASLDQGARENWLRKPLVLGGVALAALALLTAAAAALMLPSAPAKQPGSQRIAFFGFATASSDSLAKDISAAANDEVFRALLALRLEAASRAETQGVELAQQRARAAELGAAYALGGDVRLSDEVVIITVHFEDVASRTTLWEETVSGSPAEAASLSVLAAGAATRVARCMVGARPSLPRQDGDLLAQLATACATPFIAYRDAPARWRALARHAPDSAVIQANFGNSLLYHANHSDLQERELLEVWKEATTAAQKALEIEADNGVARTVLAYNAVFNGRPLAEAGALMDAAVMDSPDDWRRGETGSNRNEFLQGVGRTSESLSAARAVIDRDPLSPTPYFLLARALLHVGRGTEAGRVWEQMSARWPDSWWDTWAVYAIRDKISAIDVVLAAAPPRISEDMKTCWREIARADASAKPAVRRSGAAIAEQCAVDGRIDDDAARALRSQLLGNVDGVLGLEATALLNHKYPSNFLFNAGELFNKTERAVRADGRFLPLMKKSGIYQYWIDSGTHPDVCDLAEEKDFEICAALRADQKQK